MRQREGGRKRRGKRRSSVLVAFLLQLLPPPPICTSIPLLLSLLSLSIYLCIITVLASLISPETANFSTEEAPSLSPPSTGECVSVCREIKGVSRKSRSSAAAVKRRRHRRQRLVGEASRRPVTQRHSVREKQGRNCHFLTERTPWPGLKAEVGHSVEDLRSW